MSEAVEQAVRVRRARATRRRLHRLDAVVSPYLYVGSFFVVFCVFGLFPLGYTAWMSLTDRNLLNPTTHFVGLDNYTALTSSTPGSEHGRSSA
jgi:cellobiose transport system permease protein